MPTKPKTICTYPGCYARIDKPSRCAKHQHAERKAYDRQRPSPTKRGYTYQWTKAREQFLREHPLCSACGQVGHTTAATVVDHVIRHGGDQELFWDRANWQPMCKLCHDRKTARDDGGFGNAMS